jgi:hypothetical protein
MFGIEVPEKSDADQIWPEGYRVKLKLDPSQVPMIKLLTLVPLNAIFPTRLPVELSVTNVMVPE